MAEELIIETSVMLLNRVFLFSLFKTRDTSFAKYTHLQTKRNKKNKVNWQVYILSSAEET